MSTKRSTLTSYLTGKKLGLLAAQLLVLAFMLACIGIFIAGIFDFPSYAPRHTSEFIPYAPPWTPEIFSLILGQYGLSIGNWLLFRLVLSIFIALVFWIVGFLIFFRKGNDWFGLYIGVIFVLFGTVSGDPSTVFPGLHPELTWLLDPLSVLAWLGLFMLLFLFPNGRFTPRWTRWIGLLQLLFFALIINDFGNDTPSPLFVAFILTMVGSGPAARCIVIARYQTFSSASRPNGSCLRW